jgi:hypothetical protein
MASKDVSKRTVRFSVNYVGFLTEGAAMPPPKEVTVELSEPIARWFDEMLVPSQKEKFYKEWESSGRTKEFGFFLKDCLVDQMKEKGWERNSSGARPMLRRDCPLPLCKEVLEKVTKESWHSACRLHLVTFHGLPVWWVDLFLGYLD